MKLKVGFLMVIGSLLLSVSSAQAAFVENDYNCDLPLGEAIECGENAVDSEKVRLNKIYNSAYRTLSATQKAQLDEEQITWLKKRNEACKFEEGPMNNMMVYQMVSADVCVANETQKRSKTIVNRFNLK